MEIKGESDSNQAQNIVKTPQLTLSPIPSNVKSVSHTPENKRPTSVLSTKSINSKPLLGALTADKLYLEKLVKHPHLICLSKENKHVVSNASEALEYLNTREKFWEQQFLPPKIFTT